MFKCQECGKKFKTTQAAERASNNGCPKCGGVDIDLDVPDNAPGDPRGPRGMVDANGNWVVTHFHTGK
jgi:predicted  nucleic acid-binding Zn-ribbon protein